MQLTEKAWTGIKKCIALKGKSITYQGHCGVKTAFNSIYWLNIKSSKNNEILVENLGDIGKLKSRKIKKFVEKDLVYTL